MIEEILYDLIKYKTVYPNYKEVNECLEYIKNLTKDKYLTKYYVCNKDKSLYITNTLDNNIDVLFVGHIDVVDAPDKDFIPYKKSDNIYARGSFDMKGHDAVIISLLINNTFNKKIGVLFTSDEERGGFNGTKYFLEKTNIRPKIAIVPDAGNNFNLIDEEKGVLQLKITLEGKSAHASNPLDGINAIEEAFKFNTYLLKKYPLKKGFHTSINLSKIVGGNEVNKVPDKCVLYYDIRHTHKDTKEQILDYINSYKNVSVEILAEGEEFITIKNKYYKKYIDISEETLNKKIKITKCNSASDARFFYKYKIPCVLMNAKGKNLHSENEYVNTKSLEKLYSIYKNYIDNL